VLYHHLYNYKKKEYVDTQLIQSGKVDEAAIIGLQGGIWAKSKGIQVRLSCCKTIKGCSCVPPEIDDDK